MSDHDPVTEQAIKDIAEILAKGYLRLVMKPPEASPGFRMAISSYSPASSGDRCGRR